MNKIIKANNKITIFMAFYVLLYSNISFSTDLNFEDCQDFRLEFLVQAVW